jgi:hypothetical protein
MFIVLHGLGYRVLTYFSVYIHLLYSEMRPGRRFWLAGQNV